MTRITLGIVAVAAVFLSSCKKGFQEIETGLSYKIIEHSDTARAAKDGEVIFFEGEFRNATDSAYLISYKYNRPFSAIINSPANGQMNKGLMKLSEGDSAIFKILSDSLYFDTTTDERFPPGIKKGEELSIVIRVKKIRSRKELEEEDQANQMKRMEEMKKLSAEEDKVIADYLAKSDMSNATYDSAGYYYKQLNKTSGVAPQNGDEVTMEFKGSLVDGTVLIDKSQEPIPFILGEDPVMPGWRLVIPKMHVGESWKVLFRSDLAFGANGYQDIPPYTPMVYEFKLVKRRAKAEVEKEKAREQGAAMEKEGKDISAYLAKNKGFKKDASGIYLQPVKNTQGKQVVRGSMVKVHYTGTFLNGEIFDSSVGSEPLAFEVGAPGLIEGWTYALLQMKAGEKYKVLVPSSLGYGAMGKPPIQGYTPMLFEMEVVEVK